MMGLECVPGMMRLNSKLDCPVKTLYIGGVISRVHFCLRRRLEIKYVPLPRISSVQSIKGGTLYRA